MTPLILREGAPAQLVELADPIAEKLQSEGIAQLTRTKDSGWWEVTAGNRVGAASVGGLQLIIEPKVPISRLIFMLGYALRPDFWRDDLVKFEPHQDLPEALAAAFCRLAEQATGQGLLKGYHTVNETSPVLRGRIREADQLRRHWGRNLPLEVRYDEYTVDIAENQLLLAAAEVLLRLPPVGKQFRARLHRLRVKLADVRAPGLGVPLPRWQPSRLNVRYQPALAVAELILSGQSFEHTPGQVSVAGFLLNMAKIFEDFVCVGLREALESRAGRAWLQYRAYLDEAEAVSIRPDFVWTQQRRPVLVADAKYKAEKPNGFPQADIYQMLAYCTRLQLPVGHLVYAQGNEEPAQHKICGTDITVIAHTLDLRQSPGGLLSQLSELTDVMLPERGVRRA